MMILGRITGRLGFYTRNRNYGFLVDTLYLSTWTLRGGGWGLPGPPTCPKHVALSIMHVYTFCFGILGQFFGGNFGGPGRLDSFGLPLLCAAFRTSFREFCIGECQLLCGLWIFNLCLTAEAIVRQKAGV